MRGAYSGQRGSASHAAPTRTPRHLYAQVANALRGEIEAGAWMQGQRLPAIDDLASRFGVARATLRQAIEVMEGEGLVQRRHGLGTFVVSDPRAQRWLRLASDWESFLRMIEPLQPRLLLSEAAGRCPRILEGEGRPAPAYRHLKRVHDRDGRPFCTIDIYLAADIYLRAPDALSRGLVVPLLLQMPDVTIDRVHQTLTVDGAGQETAGLLGLPLGAPVAVVRRTIGDDAGTCIYIADVIYRGDVVKLDIDLSPPRPGAGPRAGGTTDMGGKGSNQSQCKQPEEIR